MNNKHIFALLLIAFVASGCLLTSVEPPEDLVDIDPIENPNNKLETIVLLGHTLEELGLTLSTDNLRLFKDHNDQYISYSIANFNENHRRFAKSTGLSMEYSEKNGYEMLLCIQGFRKSNNPNTEQYIVVHSNQYKLSELNEYKLYEDDEVVVYDILDLIPDTNYSEIVQNYVKKGFNWQWMLEVFEYAKTYEDIIIKRVDE